MIIIGVPKNLKEAIQKAYVDFRNLEDYDSLPYFFMNNFIEDNETYRITIEGERDDSHRIYRLTKKQLKKALDERINQLQEICKKNEKIIKMYCECKNEKEVEEMYKKIKEEWRDEE